MERFVEAYTTRANCIARRAESVSADDIRLVPYDPRWPEMFRVEAGRRRQLLGTAVVIRVEHFGSTAVPGLSAKPIIDMLIEIPSLGVALRTIMPKLREERWEYLWRDDRPPGHMMFIRRDSAGVRTHHLHMATAGQRFPGSPCRAQVATGARRFPGIGRWSGASA